MEVNVYSLDGKVAKKITLPKVFETDIRTDVIRRAVHAIQSARRQPYGPDEMAGKRTTAEPWGKGYGVSRVPRVKGTRYPAAGRAGFVPHAVGGRRAHPPKPEKKLVEKINKKEKKLAVMSAIAATKDRKLVMKRGHVVDGIPEFPLVVSAEIEELKSAKEVEKFLKNIGVWKDVERVMRNTKIRSGRGKMRGRKYRVPTGPLIVVGEDRGITKGARNIPGVNVTTVEGLNAELLAPGGIPGRLTIWTEKAIEKLGGMFA
ncbi:MAG: 50S ribosomal protein L4 [Candidatus Hadarchaeales archaeon]